MIPGFGPQMKDYDGRPVEVTALYHAQHANPKLEPHQKGEPFYWNFLEMEFDPRADDPAIGLRVRNMIDAPQETARGGGSLETTVSATGRSASSQLPEIETLANADVRISSMEGRPIRGTRTDVNGKLAATRLIGVESGTRVILTVFDGRQSKAILISTRRV